MSKDYSNPCHLNFPEYTCKSATDYGVDDPRTIRPLARAEVYVALTQRNRVLTYG